ncbi:MAG TPA: DUF550 domain-containing protein [Phycisphaerales bacterium]|nr:DUF550 domain-containing protein [Phycisphaerales bacterium]
MSRQNDFEKRWEHQVEFITRTFGPLSKDGAKRAQAHLMEELEEVLQALRDADPEHALEELADVQCLLVGVAANLGFSHQEFLQKWAWKQGVNDQRKWEKCAAGYSKHVSEVTSVE